MAKFSLNIYGKNDEVAKTYETDHVRWKLFVDAVELQETIGKKSAKEQVEVINGFMLSIFPGMKREEVEQADALDVMNTFKSIVSIANGINGTKGKGGTTDPNAQVAQE